MLVSGVTPLTTIGDVLQHYGMRPEHKSQQPDSTHATFSSVGLLPRRSVRSAPVLTALIGKEGNRLLERATGEISDPNDYRSIYSHGDIVWQHLVLPVLRAMRADLGGRALAGRLGVTNRQLRNWLNRPSCISKPAPQNYGRALEAAAQWSGATLAQHGRDVPNDLKIALHMILVRGYFVDRTES